MGRKAVLTLGAIALLAIAASAVIWHQTGAYGFNVLVRRGGTFGATMDATDNRLSPSMRLALQEPVPAVQAGPRGKTLHRSVEMFYLWHDLRHIEFKALAKGDDLAVFAAHGIGRQGCTVDDRMLAVRRQPFRMALNNQ